LGKELICEPASFESDIGFKQIGSVIGHTKKILFSFQGMIINHCPIPRHKLPEGRDAVEARFYNCWSILGHRPNYIWPSNYVKRGFWHPIGAVLRGLYPVESMSLLFPDKESRTYESCDFNGLQKLCGSRRKTICRLEMQNNIFLIDILMSIITDYYGSIEPTITVITFR
jgi:hypothetical protein